jgi:lysine 6-dehydrogenase
VKFVVVGAGRQGTACAFDLLRQQDTVQVTLLDSDSASLERAAAALQDRRLVPVCRDVRHHEAIASELKDADVLVSCVPYFLNLQLARAAVAAKAHFCDLGGNTAIVFQELALDEPAGQADVALIPDCGLAPGMTNTIVVHGIRQLDRVEQVRIRVGGLPQNRDLLLGYKLTFSLYGLINEYAGRTTILRNYRREEVAALSEAEDMVFPEPVGTVEAVHVHGGLSTLAWSLEGRVKELDYKMVRYPGHCEFFRTLFRLGLLDEQPVQVNGREVSPRELFVQVAGPRLEHPREKDVVVVRVTLRGERDGRRTELVYELLDEQDEQTGFTAMMRTTGFSIAIVAHMLAAGTITDRGGVRLENGVPPDLFLAELAARGMEVTRQTRDLGPA